MASGLLDSPELVRTKPRLVPSRVFRWIVRQFSASAVRSAYRREVPDQWEFVLGLADGAGVSASTALFLQAVDAFGSLVRGWSRASGPGPASGQSVGACSAVAVAPARSATGGVLLGKNWDGPDSIAKYNAFRVHLPEAGHAVAGSTVVALAGTNNGINDAGLAVAFNYAYARQFNRRGLPPMAVVRDVLETCTSVDEAVHRCERFTRLSAAVFVLADVRGDVAVLELTPDGAWVRRPGEFGEQGFVVATNHFLVPGARAREVPTDAVHGQSSPPELEGQLVHASSWSRYAALFDSLRAAPERVDVSVLHSALGGHVAGPVVPPRDDGFENPPAATAGAAPCSHGPVVSTGFFVVAEPAAKRLSGALGPPCRNAPAHVHQF
ncbi:MAG: hypothetical protein Kow0069_30490 [Promethearchaeota archaeon]